MNFDKAKEFVANDKKMYTIAIIVLVIGVACWLMFGGSGIPDNSGGTSATRQQLDEIKQHQQSTINRLDKIETGLNSSADRVGNVSERLTTNTERIITVERRIETSQAGVAESGRIIAESKSIIDTVRERGQR